MIRTKALDHIALTVSSLKVSEKFYRDVLGFIVLARGEGQTNLRCGDLVLSLFEARPGETAGPSGCGIHLAFRVEGTDFQSAVSELKRNGLNDERGIVEREKSRSIYFPDPDGYELEIFAQRK